MTDARSSRILNCTTYLGSGSAIAQTALRPRKKTWCSEFSSSAIVLPAVTTHTGTTRAIWDSISVTPLTKRSCVTISRSSIIRLQAVASWPLAPSQMTRTGSASRNLTQTQSWWCSAKTTQRLSNGMKAKLSYKPTSLWATSYLKWLAMTSTRCTFCRRRHCTHLAREWASLKLFWSRKSKCYETRKRCNYVMLSSAPFSTGSSRNWSFPRRTSSMYLKYWQERI